MAGTVVNNVTRFDAMESGSTVVSIGGGPGASFDGGVFVEGAGSWSRRQASRTDHGFYVDRGATVDLSAADMHICMWMQHLNRGLITDRRFILGDATNQDQHTVPLVVFPQAGGFFPLWVDVSRTPENTLGAGANEAACDVVGYQNDIGAAAGTTNNLYMDASQYTTTGYALTGTDGLFSDFVTFENTNRFGVLLDQAAGIAVFARLTIGTVGGGAVTFNDSNFGLTFVDQSLVSATFMGITLVLDNALDNIQMADGIIQSSNIPTAQRRPDFVVTGSAGVFTASGVQFLGLRTIDLNSLCDVQGGTFDALNLTQGGADITGAIIRPRTAGGVALCDDATFGSSTGINNCDVVQAGEGHAFEFTTTTSRTLTGINFVGFGPTVVTFDATDSNIVNNNRLNLPAPHGFQTGDLVYYQDQGGSAMGLTDGASYYVRAISTVILAFYNSAADATNDVNRVSIGTTIAGTAHEISSAEAAIFNNSGGALTINISGGGSIPSVRNSDGSSTTIVSSVNFTVKCVDADTGSPIQGVAVNLGTSGFGSNDVISFALTDVNGEVTASFSGATPQTVNGYAAKGTQVPTYRRQQITATIPAGGGSTTVPMSSDD